MQRSKIKAFKFKCFPRISNNNFSNNNLLHRYIILYNNPTLNFCEKTLKTLKSKQLQTFKK